MNAPSSHSLVVQFGGHIDAEVLASRPLQKDASTSSVFSRALMGMVSRVVLGWDDTSNDDCIAVGRP